MDKINKKSFVDLKVLTEKIDELVRAYEFLWEENLSFKAWIKRHIDEAHK